VVLLGSFFLLGLDRIVGFRLLRFFLLFFRMGLFLGHFGILITESLILCLLFGFFVDKTCHI